MDSERIELLIENIKSIIEKLDSLNSVLPEIIEEFEGEEFDGQNKLVSLLDDKIQSLTHEQASVMGFELQGMCELIKLIEFRRKYKFLSDQELEKVIDNNYLAVEFKMGLSKKTTDNKQSIFNTIAAIRKGWNENFGNIGYKDVKLKLGLKNKTNL